MPGLPVRRSVRLRGFDYRSEGAYFITICIFGRESLLGEVGQEAVMLSTAGELVESGWRSMPGFFPHVSLDRFVVMPNHLHGIIVLEEGFRAKGTHGGSISAIVQTFKATSSRRVRSLPKMEGVRLWQRGFYDHVIRDDDDLDRIRRYIEENPLRWGLDEENPHRSMQGRSIRWRRMLRPPSPAPPYFRCGLRNCPV